MREKDRDNYLKRQIYKFITYSQNFLIFSSKILLFEQHFCSGTVFLLDTYLIPASSLVASQVSLSRGPGTKPLYLRWGEGGNFANKTQATVWPTGPHKDS